MTLMRQIRIETPVEGGKAIMVTWVDDDKRLHVGTVIKLKDDDREWTITNLFGTEERSIIEMNRNWDNNNYDKHTGTPIKDR